MELIKKTEIPNDDLVNWFDTEATDVYNERLF